MTPKLKGRSTFPQSLLCDGLPNTAKATRTLAGLACRSPKGGNALSCSHGGVPWERAQGVTGSRNLELAGTLLCLSSVDLAQQASCTHGPWSMEESLSYGVQALPGKRGQRTPG